MSSPSRVAAARRRDHAEHQSEDRRVTTARVRESNLRSAAVQREGDQVESHQRRLRAASVMPSYRGTRASYLGVRALARDQPPRSPSLGARLFVEGVGLGQIPVLEAKPDLHRYDSTESFGGERSAAHALAAGA